MTKRHEGLVDSPFLMGIIVSRSMRRIIGLWGPSIEVTYHLQEVMYFARFRGGAE